MKTTPLTYCISSTEHPFLEATNVAVTWVGFSTYDVLKYGRFGRSEPSGGGGETLTSNDDKSLIPGIYKTSWENLGYQVRKFDSSLDGRNNGGKVPAPVQFITNLNPLISISSGIKTIFTGSDIYNQPVKGQYSQGTWMVVSGVFGFKSAVPPISPMSIIIDQSVPLILNKINTP